MTGTLYCAGNRLGKYILNPEGLLIDGRWVDRRWVIPSCPALTLKYDVYIRVEICSSVQAVKYVYKHAFKRNGRALVGLT